MKKVPVGVLVALLLAGAVAPESQGAVRLKDIARIDVGGDLQLVGYGLAVGLDGCGDTRSSTFTMQSIANMLQRMGITVPEDRIRARNTAAVMVVARLRRFHRKGSAIDVTVSSLGDATSLEGGTLLLTPLAAPDGAVYAAAQGPISVGGFSVRGGGRDRTRQNYVLAGRVPGGGIVDREWGNTDGEEPITILLFDPDFTTAGRVVEAIGGELGPDRVQALDAATVVVKSPEGQPLEDRVTLLSRIESLEIEPDMAARVVLNEKTGTIIAGESVTVAGVAIAHGNLSVEISGRPVISQPAPLSAGQTVTTEDTDIRVNSGGTGLVPVAESANVGDLARALNALGVGPRDMIAIFQALKEAGALRAELRII